MKPKVAKSPSQNIRLEPLSIEGGRRPLNALTQATPLFEVFLKIKMNEVAMSDSPAAILLPFWSMFFCCLSVLLHTTFDTTVSLGWR